MSVKPILFNTEMVRAILDGRKTVTRRTIKLPHCGYFEHEPPLGVVPPYNFGDILYVRETFQVDYLSNIPGSGRIRYKADDICSDFTFAPERYELMRRAQLKPGWRPNENMPREAARLFLRVTDVRVERLQEIDGHSVLAEGVDNGKSNPTMKKRWENMQRMAFLELWNGIIKPAGRRK